MSLKRKLFLGLMLGLLVSIPVVSSEQAPPTIPIDVSQHEINVWQAKVEFWRTWEAHQRLLDEHTARTWEAKTDFWRTWEAQQRLLDEHTARTWEAKVEFWQNFEFDTE